MTWAAPSGGLHGRRESLRRDRGPALLAQQAVRPDREGAIRERCAPPRSRVANPYAARHERPARESLEAILDKLPQATAVLARDLRVLFLNRSLQEIVRASDGLAMRTGRLVLADTRAEAELRNEIVSLFSFDPAGESSPSNRPLRARRPSLKAHYELLLGRLPHALSLLVPAEAAAVLFVSDPESAPAVEESVLRLLHDVSRAEAALAAALVRGATVEEFAASRNVSISTARTQVRALLEKTGTRRQTDLVRLIATGLATLRGE